MNTLTVSGWPPAVCRNLGLDLADGAHHLGRRWGFLAWKGRFASTSSFAAAARRWERLKTRLRHAGVQFHLAPLEWNGRVSAPGVGKRALVFPSTAYVRSVAEELCPIARAVGHREREASRAEALASIAQLKGKRVASR